MQLRYQDGPRGLHTLVTELEAQGLTVEYEPPMEQRSANGEMVVRVLIHVAHGLSSNAEDAVYTAGLLTLVKKAIGKARERFPDLKVEIEEEDKTP